MKAEITPENKAKFFAQYYPQKILHHVDYEDYCPVGFSEMLDINYYANNSYYLSLKPLSSISEEDALEVFDILFPNSGYKNEVKLDLIKDWIYLIGRESGGYLPKNYVLFIDCLRSNGYAIQWMGLTVQEMVEAGWIKLIES